MNGIVNETFSNTWCHPTKWLAKTLGKKSHFTKSLPKSPWTGLVVRNVEPCALAVGKDSSERCPKSGANAHPTGFCQPSNWWNRRHRRMSPRTARSLSSECHSFLAIWPSSKLSPGMYDIYVASAARIPSNLNR